jgi:hypothetical protein
MSILCSPVSPEIPSSRLRLKSQTPASELNFYPAHVSNEDTDDAPPRDSPQKRKVGSDDANTPTKRSRKSKGEVRDSTEPQSTDYSTPRSSPPRQEPPRQEPASPSISVPQDECQESPPTIPQPPKPLIISPPSPVLAVGQHELADPAITIHQEPTTPTVPVLTIQGERQESPITISQQPATAAIPPAIPVLAVGQHELADPAITIHQEPTTPTVPIPAIQKERQESPIVEQQPPPPTPPVRPISQAEDKPQEKSLTESGSSSGTKTPPPHTPTSSRNATPGPILDQNSPTSSRIPPTALLLQDKSPLVDVFGETMGCSPPIAEKVLPTNGWDLEVKARGLITLTVSVPKKTRNELIK